MPGKSHNHIPSHISQELHCAKTGLRIFVVVMTKEGLADTSLAKPSVKTTEYNLIDGVILKESLTGLVLAKPSFGMKTAKILGAVLA